MDIISSGNQLSEKQKKLLEKLVDSQKPQEDCIKPGRHHITSEEFCDSYPLSSAQRRLFILNEITGGSVSYNLPVAIQIDGPLSIPRLQEAFQNLIIRHEALRTSFCDLSGEPKQFIHKDVYFQIDIAETRNDDIAAIFSDFIRPLDLNIAPLLRVKVVKCLENKYFLLLDMHHIISDGRSMALLLEEIALFYQKKTPQPLYLQYKDYAVGQKEQKLSPKIQEQKKYWLKQLTEIPALNLPLNFERPLVPQFDGAVLYFSFDAQLTAYLREFAAQQGVTTYILLMAFYQLFLFKYTDQTDIIVGSSVEGRPSPEMKRMLGVFINAIPIRSFPTPAKDFNEFLKEIKSTILEAIYNQDVPFEDLVEALKLEREISRHPIFETYFDYHQDRHMVYEFDQLVLRILPLNNGSSKFDLSLEAIDKGDHLQFYFEYSRSLFTKQHVQKMAAHFENLVCDVLKNSSEFIGNFSVLSYEEKARLFFDLNTPSFSIPPIPPLFLQVFAEQVKRSPLSIAASYESETFSYSELDNQSTHLAHHLLNLKSKEAPIVAFYMDRGIPFLISMLAVFKAGMAYVPLDTNSPDERIQSMIQESQCDFVLAERKLEAHASRVYQVSQLLLSEVRSIRLPQIHPEDLAYIIFTSGSTGKPKGAMVEHQGMVNHLWLKVYDLGLTSFDVIAQTSSQTFDVSVWQFLVALMVGARVSIFSDEKAWDPYSLLNAIEAEKVSIFETVPSHMNLVMQEIEKVPAKYMLASLRWLILNGEALLAPLCEWWEYYYPEIPILNAYGPTECSDDVCHFKIERDASRRDKQIPIGKILPNLSAYVLDKKFSPVPYGVQGELYIEGIGVGRGYLDAPDKTAASFFPFPFDIPGKAGKRIYRTGDLVRYRSDGCLEYLGRSDHQIKINGQRIELGEIESVLNQYNHLLQAVAEVKTFDREQRQLIAYLVLKKTDSTSSQVVDDIRKYMESKVPFYMVPSHFVILPAFPLLLSGKVDRKALPVPSAIHSTASSFRREPSTNLEKMLTSIWCEVLKISAVDIGENFFRLGGNSLLATQMLARILRQYDVKLSLKVLFEFPTIAGLALQIEKALLEQRESITDQLPVISPDLINRYEEFPLTDIQQAYWLGRSGLFTLGDVSVHVYSEYDCTHLDLQRLESAWNRILERHEALRLIITAEGSQKILKDVGHYTIEVQDLSKESEELVEERVASLRKLHSHEVFPSDVWPLFSISAVKLNDKTRLYLSFDALILDGWSVDIVFSEWVRFYDNETLQLPKLQLSFRDYVLTAKDLKQTALYAKDQKYWLNRLHDFPLAPQLPLVKSSQNSKEQKFSRCSKRLPYLEWKKLQDIIQEKMLSPTGLLSAVFAEILEFYSGNDHFAINLTLFDRLLLHPEVNDIAGDFTSLTLLEVDHRISSTTFLMRTRKLQEQLWQDLDHSLFTGVEFIRKLAQRHPDFDNGTLFPVVFTSVIGLDNKQNDDLIRLFGNEVFSITQTPQVWLDYKAYEIDGDLVIEWDYVAELFEEGMIQSMHDAYFGLLTSIVEQKGIWDKKGVIDLPLRQQEKRKAYNSAQMAYPCRSIQDLFYEKCDELPDHPAVFGSSNSLTYNELCKLAFQLAYHLKEIHIKPEQTVAILLEKGIEQAVACMGIVLAGTTYLPIDSALPEARIEELLELGKVCCIITQDAMLSKLSKKFSTEKIISVDTLSKQLPECLFCEREPEGKLDHLMYTIFTSGSTGKPKGVMIEQLALLNTLLDLNERFKVGPKDKVLALSNLNFDLSVYDIFGMMLAGGAVVFPESNKAKEPLHWFDLILRNGITIWNTVPMFMQIFVEFLENSEGYKEEIADSLRLVMLSGDWIPVDLPSRIKKIFPKAQIVSLGGATEASIWSIAYEIGPSEIFQTSVPYGYPLRNQTSHILNKSLLPCPEGVTGDLYIGGIGLARGYFEDQEKTESSFITHPELGRLYKTGDLGRFRTEGWIEFLGRSDYQLKIGGHRIEPGEIEAVLNQHKDISQSLVCGDGGIHKRLVAFLVPQQDSPTLSISLHDPKERSAFILNQYGRRLFNAGETTIFLERSPLCEEREASYFRRKSYRRFDKYPLNCNEIKDWLFQCCQGASHRIFKKQLPIHAATLGCLLDLLSASQAPSHPLPKYRYPSAGSAYPIQVYLSIPTGLVENIEGGNYYFDPINHGLVKLSASVENTSCIAIYFTSEMKAISPLYGERSSDFSILEAGYMSRLIENYCDQEALPYEIVLLSDQNPLLNHQFKLDGQNVISCFRIGQMGTNEPLSAQIVLYSKGIADQDLSKGWYSYDPIQNEFHFIADTPFEMLASSIDTYSTLHDANYALFFVKKKNSLNELSPELLFKVGAMAQSLMDNGLKRQIGLCPIGTLDSRGLSSLEMAISQYDFLHMLLVGRVTNEQFAEKASSAIRPNVFEEEVITYLQERVPSYMVPKLIFFLEKWPLTFNGKIDQKALLSMVSPSIPIKRAITLPRNATEEMLMAIWEEIFLGKSIGVHDSIFELGGDSLLITRIALRVREAFQRSLPLRTFFEATTIADLAEILNPSRISSPSLSSSPLWQQDLNLDESIRPLKSFNAHRKPNNILLTGATGFLGAYLLSDLIKETNAKIFCLTRASSREIALERLRDNLSKYQLSVDILEKRVFPVLGDLEKPLLGCSNGEFRQLAEDVDAIYHNGASVHHIYDYKTLRDANVLSTIELLKLATLHKDKAFFYISSLTAAVDRDLQGRLEEKFPETESIDLFSGYQQTKWVSERLLYEAHKRGVSVAIFRPNTITGDERTGASSFENDHFLRLIKGCLQIGYAPAWDILVDLLPINFVSQAISKISLTEGSPGNVFHITNPHLRWTALVRMLQNMGYEICLVPPDEWRTIHLSRIDTANALFPLLSLYISEDDSETVSHKVNAKNDNSAQFLKKLNLVYPEINENYIQTHFEYLKQSGFLNIRQLQFSN